MENVILVVEDDDDFREALCDTLGMAGFDAQGVGSAEAALDYFASRQASLVISDVQMAGMDGLALLRALPERTNAPVLIMTAYGTVAQAVEAMREGAVDYLVKPFEAEVLAAKVAGHLPAAPVVSGGASIIAVDPRSIELVALAEKVARSHVGVMISGPSGSGKEILARHIHTASPRANKPFVAVNCAAIPDNMLEAMLFGYEKGAYTGAHKACPGKFEQANSGTLLLDEITEMDLGLQAKLLRVLQEHEVERLGGRQPIALDVRVIATSNRDLRQAVADGDFREDLFYRVNVFPLNLPPLNARPGDILPLAEHLLSRHAKQHPDKTSPVLSEAAVGALCAYGWPGNVRELENIIQRALVLYGNGRIEVEDLIFENHAQTPAAIGGAAPAITPVAMEPDRLNQELKGRESRIILDALQACMGSRKDAAEKLGISPRTLRYKLARMRSDGVDVPAMFA